MVAIKKLSISVKSHQRPCSAFQPLPNWNY